MASLLYFTELFKEFMKQPWPDLVVTVIRGWSGSSSCYKSSKAFSFKALQLSDSLKKLDQFFSLVSLNIKLQNKPFLPNKVIQNRWKQFFCLQETVYQFRESEDMADSETKVQRHVISRTPRTQKIQQQKLVFPFS